MKNDVPNQSHLWGTTKPTVTKDMTVHQLTPRSSLHLHPGAFGTTPEEVSELLEFMRSGVKATPNPRNPRTFLHRKQCTFALPGAREYEFGQFNEHFHTPLNEWPALVRRALEQTRTMTEEPSLYNGVHVNLYEHGGVGVAPHRDNETSLVKGKPIFSFTVLHDPSTPRNFAVYENDKCTEVLSLPLHHGDVLVMQGCFQDEFTHGLPKARRPKTYAPRINLTVRAFGE